MDLSVRGVGQCAPDSLPEHLPSPDALVDVSSLSRALQELRRSGELPDGWVVLSMEYTADGVNVRRDVIEHILTPLAADSVQELVFANRRTGPEVEQQWGVRLRIDLGPDITYDVQRRVYCPPRPRSQEIESAMHEFISTGVRYRGGSRVRTVLLRVRVHPAGYVADAEVVRGETPGGTRERDLVTYIRQFSFHPATVDGVPVFGDIIVPVRMRD